MKKCLMAVASAMLFLASCSGGKYDQKVVDELQGKDGYTEAEYKTMINQLNYALDDMEKASDLSKWAEQNEEEAMSVLGLGVALEVCSASDPNFPKNLKDEAKKTSERVDKISAKLKPSSNDDVDFSNIDEDVEVEVSDEY